MKLKPINEQIVAVVGASSGIGREAALQFARRGARLVVSARSESGLASLVDGIKTSGGDAIAVVADVAEFEQVKAIADKAVATYGRLDTWVNAAATGVFAPFEEITQEEFERVIQVTLMGQVYGVKAALPYLKQAGGGALIHVSSMEGRRALPLQSPYSTAKHGLEGFLEALRVELQHEKLPISVTSIKPAVINTPFYNNGLTKLGVKPTGIPPYYAPELVAAAILYAAEHPTRDYIVGDVGRVLDLLQRLSPGLVDLILTTIGFQFQKTDESKSVDDPNNLYNPVPDHDQVKGDFGHLVIPSLTDWFALSPALKGMAIAGTTMGLIALSLLAAQALKDGQI